MKKRLLGAAGVCVDFVHTTLDTLIISHLSSPAHTFTMWTVYRSRLVTKSEIVGSTGRKPQPTRYPYRYPRRLLRGRFKLARLVLPTTARVRCVSPGSDNEIRTFVSSS